MRIFSAFLTFAEAQSTQGLKNQRPFAPFAPLREIFAFLVSPGRKARKGIGYVFHRQAKTALCAHRASARDKAKGRAE
jgi:hypothetical protein